MMWLIYHLIISLICWLCDHYLLHNYMYVNLFLPYTELSHIVKCNLTKIGCSVEEYIRLVEKL